MWILTDEITRNRDNVGVKVNALNTIQRINKGRDTTEEETKA